MLGQGRCPVWSAEGATRPQSRAGPWRLQHSAARAGFTREGFCQGCWTTAYGDATSVPTGTAASPGKEGNRPQPADILQPGHRVPQARGWPAAACRHEGERARAQAGPVVLKKKAGAGMWGARGPSRTAQASAVRVS